MSSKITKVAIRMIPIGLVASTILAGCVGPAVGANGPSDALTLRAHIASERADASAVTKSNQAVISAHIASEHQDSASPTTKPNRLNRDEDGSSGSSTNYQSSNFRGK